MAGSSGKKRTLRTYVFHVPDTPEYQPLIRILASGPYPGGIRDRSKFVREVLMDALGLRQRPWGQALPPQEPPRAGAGESAGAARLLPSEGAESPPQPAPDPAVEATLEDDLPPDMLAMLAAGVRKVRQWEGGASS